MNYNKAGDALLDVIHANVVEHGDDKESRVLNNYGVTETYESASSAGVLRIDGMFIIVDECGSYAITSDDENNNEHYNFMTRVDHTFCDRNRIYSYAVIAAGDEIT